MTLVVAQLLYMLPLRALRDPRSFEPHAQAACESDVCPRARLDRKRCQGHACAQPHFALLSTVRQMTLTSLSVVAYQGFLLAVELEIPSGPLAEAGLDPAAIKTLLDEAHKLCPYSRAVSGNVVRFSPISLLDRPAGPAFDPGANSCVGAGGPVRCGVIGG